MPGFRRRLARRIARGFDAAGAAAARRSLADGPVHAPAGAGPDDRPWQHKWNVLETAIAFSIANNVLGDFLEFGVFQGRSFAHAYGHRERLFERYRTANAHRTSDAFLGHRMRYFAFDSFAGLPATEQQAIPLHWRGDAAMACDEPTFRGNLAAAGVDLDVVHTLPGYFDQSLTPAAATTLGLQTAAIIHVDCDLEESTAPVLDFVRPFVVDGTVIVFDDWFYYRGHPARGEAGAFAAWLASHPELVATELARTYPAAAFILNRR